MNNDIEIKINHFDDAFLSVYIMLITLILFMLIPIIVYSSEAFGTVLLITVLYAVVFYGFADIYVRYTAVVRADNEKLEYKHFFKLNVIKLHDINELRTEFYSVDRRCCSKNRIRLIIIMKSGEEYELNDAVDADEYMNNTLNNKQTQIPLLKLCEFIRSETGADIQ